MVLLDDFNSTLPCGAVLGTSAASGHERLGVDVERVMSVDNGALRLAPLLEAGFGRAVLGYGPFRPRPGSAFAVYLLNGHNTSQAEPFPDTFSQRIAHWLGGSQTEWRVARLLRWLRSGQVKRVLRQLRRWKRAAKGGRPVPRLDENLLVGWVPELASAEPMRDVAGFIMHALGPENGELWAGHHGSRTRALRGVQNVPLYLVAVTRAEGIVYYVSGPPDARGVAAHPWLRAIAVDAKPPADGAYLSVNQAVMGQIGWRADTRVYGVRVATIDGFDAWHGGAHAADRLDGVPVAGRAADAGGQWEIHQTESRHAGGSVTARVAVLRATAPTGLLHAIVRVADASEPIGLVWRFRDPSNHWRFELGRTAWRLSVVVDGEHREGLSGDCALEAAGEHRVQILDDGLRMMAYVDGEPVAAAAIKDDELSGADGAGILYGDGGASRIRRFEAHPVHVRLPASLDMGAPWVRKGRSPVAADDFAGPRADLAGRRTPIGGLTWNRTIGRGVIEITGEGHARVKTPCPGRTAYCVDWPHEDFVDIEVTVIPPGRARGERQRTTAGFILYQDADNFMTLNAYRSDSYGGGSMSTFFKFNGFEDIYDAIWSNVFDRVFYGKRARLRLCCDGDQYAVFIDDEAILYRKFRDVYPDVGRLSIRKVGILANWEFGTDTGSVFEHCTMRY